MLFLLGASLVSFSLFRTLWILTTPDECPACGWHTKNEDGTCAGCGAKR